MPAPRGSQRPPMGSSVMWLMVLHWSVRRVWRWGSGDVKRKAEREKSVYQ